MVLQSDKKIFLAELDKFDGMMDFIRTAAETSGLSLMEINKIELALEEAIVNVINYAYPQKDQDSVLELEFQIIEENSQKKLKYVMTDAGIAFDPLKKETPDINADLEDRPIGGLGIFMIKKIMNEVFYSRTDSKNILTMIKIL